MDFPITDLMDEEACYAKPVAWLHPEGPACPRCRRADRMCVHRRHCDPVLDYRYGHCRRVFNAFNGTTLHGTKRRPVQLVLIVRGFAQGVPTAQLARELDCDRSELLVCGTGCRTRPTATGTGCRGTKGCWRPTRPTRTRGKKGVPHPDPEDPPHRRANKRRCHGSWETGRPPVCSVVGRESGRVRLTVAQHSDGATLKRVVREASWPMATVNTDEWQRYSGMPAMGRRRATVCHSEREWARVDGDGGREVHVNTLEGLWTGLRNFLRPFRGVSKAYLHPYVALFEWGYNLRRATTKSIRALLGAESATKCPT